MKAVLIQSAIDLVHETRDVGEGANWDTGEFVRYHRGPDYATGYGLIDLQAAASIVAEGRITENVTGPNPGVYVIRVPEGASRLRMTLAWDDLPGNELSGSTVSKLVNDLDVVATAPDGSSHLPWVVPPLKRGPDNGPFNRKDPVSALAVKPAEKGIDRLNNVEQVEVDNPLPGLWYVKVSAYRLPTLGRQGYSLASDFPFEVPRQFGRVSSCRGLAWTPQASGRFRTVLPADASCAMLSLNAVCLAAMTCGGCAFGRCDSPVLRIQPNSAIRGVELMDSDGKRVLSRSMTKSGLSFPLNWSHGANAQLVVLPTTAQRENALEISIIDSGAAN
jgi:hypothetical protein